MALDPVLQAEMMELIQREKQLKPKVALVESKLAELLPVYAELRKQFEALHQQKTGLEQQKAAFDQELEFITKDKQKLRMKQRLIEGGGGQSVAQAQHLLESFADAGIKPDHTAAEVKEVDLEAQLAALKKKMDD